MDSDVFLSIFISSFFLKDVPMQFREKVLLCVLIMRWMDTYIKTESDIIWVNNQLKKMESEFNNVARGTNAVEWNRTSDDEIHEAL